ncbi:methylaspartate mutase [candidate division TA06 bacterium]|uniref:Methylaspartate mutase n=1 Tax=candidate division TA06 bacterium TaxID=2250710 RepID=A0A660S804_UNCT6|nr:MAG: methylaspartate mutase [candidate division TA06 bacterium]
MIKPEEIKSIVATDCGSTTTKAILIEKKEDGYRLIVRGEAPTTVEAPFEDVTRGVLNAVTEVEELANKEILDGENFIKPYKDKNHGIDIYISTSSAGGGLQMMVAGVVKTMTAESAARAALGAGAIVMDTIASNDGRQMHEKIERIRTLRPDMILLSGGVDGGTISHVAELSEIIAAADPKPRFGSTYKLPVIFAGNKDAREIVKNNLGEKTDLFIVENLRPVLERENLKPARDKIHDLFMEHVMAQAPGYKKLMSWTDVSIMPTPGAVGLLIEKIAKKNGIEVLGVDIGGATTDVFSVFQEIFNRTVSANLGMSYSISNVMASSGIKNIMRWIPFHMDEKEVRNRIKNKMIRPTTIPQTIEDLQLEQAIAREALRLALEQHKTMAVSLKGVQQERTISDTFNQTQSGATLVNMETLNMIVGSGGVLSHAPRRVQSAFMMIDAFLPEGFTMLTVDSIFMMPQLGVLSQVHEQAATEVFDKDCLIRLGTCIAPIGNAKKYGSSCITVSFNGNTKEVKYGEMALIPLGVGEKMKIKVKPEKNFDMGEGNGKEVTKEVEGGVVGLIIDARGRRPFTLPEDNKLRVEKLTEWNKVLGTYPEIK